MSLLCTEVSAGACPCSKQPAAGGRGKNSRVPSFLELNSWLNPVPFTNQLFFETGSHTVQVGLEPPLLAPVAEDGREQLTLPSAFLSPLWNPTLSLWGWRLFHKQGN